ncbi:23439_t:CDS:2 [Dentiscutata erythropus]|uniref:23439_t:CDS:1 n=1 Tax=Dentiscutata erythropus TaxID=1348616 RepID=A0A9N9GBZ7_9GLOM|nr:23439_t:CDS:2 [Dentiscutata erythropus]
MHNKLQHCAHTIIAAANCTQCNANEVEESTIINCWRKTGILPLLLDTEIEDATFAVQDFTDIEKDNVDELIIDLTTNLSDPTIEHQLNEFNNVNNSQIFTKDVLDKEQIVNIVLDEQWELEEGNTSDSDEEPPEIPVTEGLNGLKKIISFVEQQKSCDFNAEDLKVFRKYLTLIKKIC